MKTSTQLKALVRNLSKSKKVEAEIILRNFMLERFLERISDSPYKNDFILKGGMLVAAIVGIDARSTMDLDATIKGRTLTKTEITDIIENILKVQIDDNIVFTLNNIEEIHEEADYPGFRVSLNAVLDKTRQTFHIDITTGDLITPKEIEYSFQLMFENKKISIFAYNLETVLAEKFETIIARGLINTRMRDFYDIYILTTTQNIDLSAFQTALKATSMKRHTFEQIRNATAVIEKISISPTMMALWKNYQKKYNYALNVRWKRVINSLHILANTLLS